jgi:hypothetical protein
MVHVISLVTDLALGLCDRTEQRQTHADVSNVARCQRERDQSARLCRIAKTGVP